MANMANLTVWDIYIFCSVLFDHIMSIVSSLYLQTRTVITFAEGGQFVQTLFGDNAVSC